MWLKTGGFSFENTPLNLERLSGAFPELPSIGSPAGLETVLDWAKTPPLEALGHPRTAFQPRHTPWPFQGQATARSVPCRAFAVFGEMGTGKTKILIDSIGQLWSAGRIDAVFIVAPKGVHSQWIEEQFPEHCGNLPWQGAAITRQKKPPTWDLEKLCVLAVNFDFAKGAKGHKICKQFIDTFKGRVMMIVDESQEIRSMTTGVTEQVTALGALCDYRRISTGTPIGKNLTDALPQYQFLDERILGHRYKSSFQQEYCIMGGYENGQVIGQKNVEQFWAKVAPYTFRITKEEADLNLPPKVYEKLVFELSDEQRHHYLALKADMITRFESGELMAVPNAIGLMVRLQQVTCGFLSVKGDKDAGIPDKLQFLKNNRMDALNRVLSERTELGGKTVIWARFNEDIEGIAAQLKDRCMTYYGPTSDKKRSINKARFLDPNDNTILVANPAAGGAGFNLQGHCRTVIYYSNSFDAIDRWQSEDRVHRHGMLFPITYIDLVAHKTIDRKLLANLRQKKSLADLAFDDIRKMVMED